jgi:hypothetical protein
VPGLAEGEIDFESRLVERGQCSGPATRRDTCLAPATERVRLDAAVGGVRRRLRRLFSAWHEMASAGLGPGNNVAVAQTRGRGAKILRPEVIQRALRLTEARLTTPAAVVDRKAVREELHRVERQMANLATAVSSAATTARAQSFQLSTAQAAASGTRGSGPTRPPSILRVCHSISACAAVPIAAAFCFSRSAALAPTTARASSVRTNSGSRAPGRVRTSRSAVSKWRRSSLTASPSAAPTCR